MDLVVETIDGEPLERDKARSLSKRDKFGLLAAPLLEPQYATSLASDPVLPLLCWLPLPLPAVFEHTVHSGVCMPAVAVGGQCLDVLARLQGWGPRGQGM